MKTGESVRNGGNGNFMIYAGHRYSRIQSASDTIREHVGWKREEKTHLRIVVTKPSAT